MKEQNQIKIDYADATRLALLEQSIGSISQALIEMKHENKIRFDKIDGKFDKIEHKFDKIDEKFDKIENKLEDMNQRMHLLHLGLSQANLILSGLKWFAATVVAYLVLPYIKSKFL
jgi:predicted nuclease with TOPRIM domain